MSRYGRDPRRRLTLEERRLLYERARGLCERCGIELGPDYHSAHLAAWTNGGATHVDQMQAWCASCNLRLGGRDASDLDQLNLREWQRQALPAILQRIYQARAATLHASPGAGKTLFAGAVFDQLHRADLIDRMVVVVPNRALVTQWKEALGTHMRIHLDEAPRDGVIELEGTAGSIVTYHSLPGSAGAQYTRLSRHRTLVVLDEVHHIAEDASWGKAVNRMVGDLMDSSDHAASVLNMTGTLFRSKSRSRISTVHYDRVDTPDGEKMQASADWSIPTADLLGVELRAPDLYAYSGDVELVDLSQEEIVRGEFADLDKPARFAAIRQALNSKAWVTGFAEQALRLLRNQIIAIEDREPLKLLFVANDQRAAKKAADAINQLTGQDFARLVISDEPEALRTLRSAARDRHSCAIVAVQMVTEGFDCPEVSTVAYATNKIADLFIAQTMARSMRVTATERSARRMLPAQILIPDAPELRKAFASALVGTMHILDPDEPEPANGTGSGQRMPRYELLHLSDPRLQSATVLNQDDGDVLADELNSTIAECESVGIPETYAPRVAVVRRRYRPPVRIYDLEVQGPAGKQADAMMPPSAAAETEGGRANNAADPRSLNKAHRGRLKAAAGWMFDHVDHDREFPNIATFQAEANAAGQIPRGGRDQATTEQLRSAADWMITKIVQHCERNGEPVPSWTSESET